MKQTSQEPTFSDVQLEDPEARRNSNAGLVPILLFFFLLNCHFPWWFSPIFLTITGNVEASRLQASVSPADLHGMWYPTVRRTLVCLSKLYRCIDVSAQLANSCYYLWLTVLPTSPSLCCWLWPGAVPESRLPGFISRSLICLHPVAAQSLRYDPEKQGWHRRFDALLFMTCPS